MAITKLLLLSAVVAAEHYGTTPPNGRPPSDELREQTGAELAIGYFIALAKITVWSWALIEGSLLFALSEYCPPSLSRLILHHLMFVPTDRLTQVDFLSSLTTLTPAFLTGTLFSISGGLLRGYCFHTLGRFFTFELSIRKGHTLVTRGPYGVVRHPSYTGGILLALGLFLCTLERRGWVVACSGIVPGGWTLASEMSGTGIAVRTGLGLLGSSIVGAVVGRRMDREDEMLEKNFGEEWKAWVKKVPYRLVPGVY